MDLHSLPKDHIDLLMTAALEFGVVAAPPETPRAHQVETAMAQRLGTNLYLRNQSRADGYRFRAVEGVLDVRDVLKAAHAAQHAYRDTKLWLGSSEQRVVDAIAEAASMRVPGYELSPWVWTRPSDAVGFAPGWRPSAVGIEWVEDVDDLYGVWKSAQLVLLSRDGLRKLIPQLPARSRVYLITEPREVVDGFREAEESAVEIEGVLIWPAAGAWLRQQLVA